MVLGSIGFRGFGFRMKLQTPNLSLLPSSRSDSV